MAQVPGLVLVIFCSTVILGNALQQEWELGPFMKQDDINPIMGPLNHTNFFCPMRQAYVRWEEKDVFNPAAVVKDGLVHMLYRAEDTIGMYLGTSRIGLAVSTDGLTFTRLTTPVFYPDRDSETDYEWEGGCEDPRIVEDESGTYFMTYTAFDGKLARLFVASSRDLQRWTKYGPVFKNANNGTYNDMWSKAGSIVTRQFGARFVATKVNGKYWMYWGDTNMYAATSDDLINWTPVTSVSEGETEYNLTAVFKPRPLMFDSDLVEPGPGQAILRSDGILLIYNSRNKKDTDGGDPSLPEGTYSAGQVLLNATNPLQLVNRSFEYFMTPDRPYETIGQVNNVVFLEGMVFFKNSWFIYYGTADSKIAVAKTWNKA